MVHQAPSTVMQAGLGGKTLSFVDTCDAEMFHEDLLPKLRTGGGYELLRTNERNNRSLDVIPPPPSGYTVKVLQGKLRSISDHYKRIWIWHLLKGRAQ